MQGCRNAPLAGNPPNLEGKTPTSLGENPYLPRGKPANLSTVVAILARLSLNGGDFAVGSAGKLGRERELFGCHSGPSSAVSGVGVERVVGCPSGWLEPR